MCRTEIHGGDEMVRVGLSSMPLSSWIASLPIGCYTGEGGSEDPVLTGALATAWTTGLQNSSADPHRIQVAVTLKHMAANSLESTIGWSAEEAAGSFTRHNISVNVSNFTLSDAYFPGFRAAIKHAGAKGIMCSCTIPCANNIKTTAFLLSCRCVTPVV